MSVKKIKNTTGSTIIHEGTGISFPTGGIYITIDPQDLLKFNTSQTESLVSGGQFVVNDGTSDLNSTLGIQFLQDNLAAYIGFDNSSNNFTANKIQPAIEEAKTTAIGKPRFTIITTFNGTVTNNQWLGYNELLPGNTSPIVVPISCTLKEITLSFNGIAVDGRIDIYKNGTAAGNLVINTLTLTNINTKIVFSGLSLNLVSGDYIIGRWIDTGDNPSDLAVVYFFQAT